MNKEQFGDAVHAFLSARYQAAIQQQFVGTADPDAVVVSGDGGWLLRQLRIPAVFRVVETPTHLLAELLGVAPLGQAMRRHVMDTEHLDDYLNGVPLPITPKALVTLAAANVALCGLWFANTRDANDAAVRFHLKHAGQPQFFGADYNSPFDRALSVNPARCDSFTLQDVVLFNSDGRTLRAREILFAYGTSKSRDCHDVATDLLQRTSAHPPERPFPAGMMVFTADVDADIAAGRQLLSEAFDPQRREPAITSFVEAHPRMIRLGLGATHFVAQPRLVWLQGNPDPEEDSIQPDFLLQRADGFYDICDFKLLLSEKAALTTRERRRRRFTVDVADGIAQLVNYKDYFRFGANRAYAAKHFGVRVQDPKLILVIGNQENLQTDRVQEAMRNHCPEVTVLDYESMVAVYLANARRGN